MTLVKRCLWVFSAVFLLPQHGMGQGLRVDPSVMDGQGGWKTQWDSAHDRLILYRNAASRGTPAARIFQNDGTSIAVYPLEDLPESWAIDVWGAAATPEGGMVLTAIVNYSPPSVKPPQIKSLLLTYDLTGKLQKVWNVEPYHHHFVATDRSGDVFALGDANLNAPYPLIIKYSPTGAVLREFLSSATFQDGDAVLANGSPGGDPELFVKGDHLFVWLPHSQDLLSYSLTGDLISRTPLAKALSQLTAVSASDHTKVRFLTATEQGDVIAQVQLWPKTGSKGAVQTAMVGLSADGSSARELASLPNPASFLGSNGRGHLLFLEQTPGDGGGTVTEH